MKGGAGAPRGPRRTPSGDERRTEAAASDAKPSANPRPYEMRARAQAAERTGQRVLEAALSLFTDRPYEDVSLVAVAERAQVTKQTVLRRFGTKEDLFVAALNHAALDAVSQREAAPVGDIPGAVANLIEHYERFGANRLRFLSQEDTIPIVARNVRAGRAWHLSWVQRTFAPLIQDRRGKDRKRRLAALVALTDVYMWKLLRRDLKLSRSETEGTLVELIQALGANGEGED